VGECEELFLSEGFMVKYPQMKFAAVVLVALLVHASAFAGARMVVPSLPEAATPDAEVSTNIASTEGSLL